MNLVKKASKSIGLGFLLAIVSQATLAIQEGWYLGGGYGATHLDPKVPFDIFTVSENQSELTRVIAGYDVDQLGSIEFSVTDLGEATLTNSDTVSYTAANVAGLYRLYDSQSSPYSNQTWGVNLFGKLGLGYLKLDSETALESESHINMLVGAGAEFSMFGGLSLRTELEFVDTDAHATSISLLKRFRFDKKQPERIFDSNESLSPDEELAVSRNSSLASIEQATLPLPLPVVPKPVVVVPAPVEINTDVDNDGVTDSVDKCLDSKPGYPVRTNGCGMLNGVLSNLKFAKFSSELTDQTSRSLRGLANLLNKYPTAVVRMGSHTANEGSEASQRALTRDRILSIGQYLRQLGVSPRRVKYMAFGAKVPFKGRATDRIDIKELN